MERRIAFQVSAMRGRTLTGYAAIFGAESQDLGGFVETVRAGAFARSLRSNPDVKALINHEPSLLLGRTPGTLKLEEDTRGLKFRVALPDTSYARDIYFSIRRGDATQCSFAFTVREQRWGTKTMPDGREIATRELLDAELLDVSIVTFPAYTATTVSADERARVDEVSDPASPLYDESDPDYNPDWAEGNGDEE